MLRVPLVSAASLATRAIEPCSPSIAWLLRQVGTAWFDVRQSRMAVPRSAYLVNGASTVAARGKGHRSQSALGKPRRHRIPAVLRHRRAWRRGSLARRGKAVVDMVNRRGKLVSGGQRRRRELRF